MKKLTKLKTLLAVLTASCCVAGFTACITTPDNSSGDSLDSSAPAQGEYAVYYSTAQSDYSVPTEYYDENETVSLPTCNAKTLGNYTLPFKYWANAETDKPVTEDFTMPAGDVFLYAVYDNGMESGDRDFELREDGYVALSSDAHGKFSNLALDSDGDVYSLDITLPAKTSDYSIECGPTFAAGSYEEVEKNSGSTTYSTNNFKYYIQLFITRAYNSNAVNSAAGNLVVYIYDASNALATLKTVTLSSLSGTEYYQKFNKWMASSEAETFTFTVRMENNGTASNYYIGVDGVEYMTLSLGDTAGSGKTLTADYFSHTIVGIRSKSTNVRFNNPKVASLSDYTLTLDANGGTLDGEAETELKISEYDYANLPTPVRSGYTFRYWYTYNELGEEVKADADDFNTNEQMKLGGTYYAKWKDDSAPAYTVAFDTGVSGYTVNPVSDYQLGDALNLPTLSNTLYTFDGNWYYDEAKTQAIDFTDLDATKLSIDVASSTITLYAKATCIFTGEGTESSPYAIATADDLKAFAGAVTAGEKFSGKYLAITADIDLGSSNWTPIPAGFAGTLNGAKSEGGTYTISNLNIANWTANNAGLFASLTAGTVKNLTLSVNIASTGSNAGGVAGNAQGTVTIENVTVSGNISAKDNVGGIIGWVTATGDGINVQNCTNNATVTATNTGAGGIIGSKADGKVVVTDCVNNGAITTNGQFAGGIVGIFRAGTGSSISGCYNYGNVTATTDSTAFVGGIVGLCRVTMTDCYCLSTATISYGKTTVTSKAASEYEASVNAGAGYLAGGLVSGTSATGTVVGSVTGGGLCDANDQSIEA